MTLNPAARIPEIGAPRHAAGQHRHADPPAPEPAAVPAAAPDPVTDAIDAVDQMVEIVDGLEVYMLHSDQVKRHGVSYRLNLLWVHSFAALLMAPLLAYTGLQGMSGPSFAFLRTVPGAPTSIATVLGVGGLVLGMGCVFRAKHVEIAGLCLLAVFYVLFGASFIIPPIMYFTEHRLPKPPLYSPVVYGHLAVIMAMHIRALVVALRDDLRRERKAAAT